MTTLSAPALPTIGLVVIEDDWFTVDEISSALAGSRYRILEAIPSVEQAMRTLGPLKPRAAILDGTLRGQSTAGVVRYLQSTHIPFMMLTASPPIYQGALAQTIPALLKPFAHHDLRSTLDRLPIASPI